MERELEETRPSVSFSTGASRGEKTLLMFTSKKNPARRLRAIRAPMSTSSGVADVYLEECERL
ncbi:hypothetical protein EYF80_064832 [Liparis tanakae]|uniref:Uncharacterized protein n=1 Tax=Liparis tanakae TaxID=230148 RepID=A0A4Z2E8F1_9TELE|nr:hypothetical protein EYF80_064832 [Liparis tanakae]